MPYGTVVSGCVWCTTQYKSAHEKKNWYVGNIIGHLINEARRGLACVMNQRDVTPVNSMVSVRVFYLTTWSLICLRSAGWRDEWSLPSGIATKKSDEKVMKKEGKTCCRFIFSSRESVDKR